MEQSQEEDGINLIPEPTDEDVLYGRGKDSMYHPGNLRLQDLVNQEQDKYESSRKDGKKEVTGYIVQVLRSEGRRFLRFNKKKKAWIEVSDEEARFKVSHAMRDRVLRKSRGMSPRGTKHHNKKKNKRRNSTRTTAQVNHNSTNASEGVLAGRRTLSAADCCGGHSTT